MKGVTKDYKELQRATMVRMGYKDFQGVTWGNNVLQGVTAGYRRLEKFKVG